MEHILEAVFTLFTLFCYKFIYRVLAMRKFPQIVIYVEISCSFCEDPFSSMYIQPGDEHIYYQPQIRFEEKACIHLIAQAKGVW